MGQKFKFDNTEYDVENLSDKAKEIMASLQFATSQIVEIENMKGLLQRAKNSYLESLKQEILANKAGVLFGDD